MEFHTADKDEYEGLQFKVMNYKSSTNPAGHLIVGSSLSYFGAQGPETVRFDVSTARGECTWKWKPVAVGDDDNNGNNDGVDEEEIEDEVDQVSVDDVWTTIEDGLELGEGYLIACVPNNANMSGFAKINVTDIAGERAFLRRYSVWK